MNIPNHDQLASELRTIDPAFKEARLVAPLLEKPGVRVDMQAFEGRVTAIADFFKKEILTKEFFNQYGFLVIDHHTIAVGDFLPDRGIFARYVSQYLHHDGGDPDVIALRYLTQSDLQSSHANFERSTDTAICVRNRELTGYVGRYFAELDTAIFEKEKDDPRIPILEFIQRVRKELDKAATDQEASANFIFNNCADAFRGIGTSYEPHMKAFYTGIPSPVYYHLWEQGQLLLLDNINLVHSGVKRTDRLAKIDIDFLNRRFYQWSGEAGSIMARNSDYEYVPV